MNKLSTEEMNHIRSSVNIVDVISEYLPLTQRGKNFFGVCPFHDDHSPSMSVSEAKQIYTCFSCGASGNVFQFVMDYEHISFPETLKKIADKGGIPFELDGLKETSKVDNVLYDLYELSQKFYQNNINTQSGFEAKEYLKSRQIEEEVIKEFGIGLALKNREMLTKLFLKKNYDPKDLLKSGLVIKNEYGYSDIYSNRIMFPLWDLNGRVVGYSGRIYHNEDTSKYINSKETELFKKGELLYNYHRAKDAARFQNVVILMEGFMDVIRAYTIGIKNVVATMGTAVTKQQASILKKMAKEIILCFDGDEAGAKATFSCSNELLELGISPLIVRLEEQLDPDDYIKKYGKERFLEKLAHPINVMDFKLSYLKKHKDLSDTVDLATYVKEIVKELEKIEDPILKEITLKKISEESDLDLAFLRDQLHEKNPPTMPIKKTVIAKTENTRLTKYHKAERFLMYAMLHQKEAIRLFHSYPMTHLPTKEMQVLSWQMEGYYKETKTMEIADFMTYLQPYPAILKTVQFLESLSLKEEYSLEELVDYIKVIQEYNLKEEKKRLQQKMVETKDEIEKSEIGKQILALGLEMKTIKGEENERN